MKSAFYITLLLFIFSFNSCTVEKRLYTKGFSISYKKSIRDSKANVKESAKTDFDQTTSTIENSTVESDIQIIEIDSLVGDVTEEPIGNTIVNDRDSDEIQSADNSGTVGFKEEKLKETKLKSNFTGGYFLPDTYAILAHCGFALMGGSLGIGFLMVVNPWLILCLFLLGLTVNLGATLEGVASLRTQEPIRWWFTKISLYFYLGMYIAFVLGGIVFVFIEES